MEAADESDKEWGQEVEHKILLDAEI
jgi:hypothetical protein